MSNPHTLFIGIVACSLFLTLASLFIENRQSIMPMLTILLPVLLTLLVVLIVTKKFWINARLGDV